MFTMMFPIMVSPISRSMNSPSDRNPTAESLAAELLDEAARSRRQAPPAVPFLLRSPELMALAPAVRERVLTHARRSAATNPKALLALLLYGACVVALLFVTGQSRFGMLLGAAPMLLWLLHTLNIRRHARRLARDLVREPV